MNAITAAGKPVPKSLHTITAIVQVARIVPGHTIGAEHAIDEAMRTLGLSGRDDPHALRAAALKQLQRG